MTTPHESTPQAASSQRRSPRAERSTSLRSKELCLRFTCPKCDKLLSVPLRTIGSSDTCPGCSKAITIPQLDSDVVGLELILKSHTPPPQPWSTPCPVCAEPLHVDVMRIDHPLSCPKCSHEFRASLVSSERPTIDGAGLGGSAPHVNEHQGTVTPKQQTAAPHAADEPSVHQWLAAAAEEPMIPRIVTEAFSSAVKRIPRSWHIQRPARWIYRAIYWGVFVLGMLTAARIGSQALIVLALVWLVPRLGGSISHLITRFLVTTYSCPRCHETYPCVSIWKCSCGYQDHREKHVLGFTCPLCGAILGRTDCRRCGSTILIW